jgi:hypothetical protein
MTWPQAERLLTEIGPDGRRQLLALLESADDVRADVIGRLHVRDDGADLAELLILLEEKGVGSAMDDRATQTG